MRERKVRSRKGEHAGRGREEEGCEMKVKEKRKHRKARERKRKGINRPGRKGKGADRVCGEVKARVTWWEARNGQGRVLLWMTYYRGRDKGKGRVLGGCAGKAKGRSAYREAKTERKGC